MANRSKRPRPTLTRIVSSALLLMALSVGLVSAPDDAAQSAEDTRPTVGLVNEDLADNFNGKEYTFGVSFVERISKDTEYNWVVLSRAVAEKTYKDGSVDAVLYVPQSFSHDILTLQELTPTKANIDYKLRHQSDERADQLLESKILGIVQSFNQGVVKMYYASLAGNIAEADVHMNSTLSNQEALVLALTSEVQEPFSGTLPNIENFVSSTTGLKQVNASMVEAQGLFTESVTNSLTTTGEAFSGQLPQVDEYAARQQEIARINTTNGNKGISDQAASDLSFYGTQFDGLKNNILCRITGLNATDEPAPCVPSTGTASPTLNTRIGEMRDSIAQYSTAHSLAISNLQNGLIARITALEAFETILTARFEPEEPEVPEEPEEPAVPEVPAVPEEPEEPTGPTDTEILDALRSEIRSLKAVLDSITGGSIPSPAFEPSLGNLDSWSTGTTSNIKESALTSSEVKSLTTLDWGSYTSSGSDFYVDSSDDLHTTITSLVAQTLKTVNQIADSSATVPDNSSQFDSLLQNATTTLSGASKVFTGLNDLVTTGTSGLEENQSYYANFSTVLANTRTPGVDTSNIYEFFAAPISAKNITPGRTPIEQSANPASWADFKLAAVFGGGLLAGALAAAAGGAFRKRKNARNSSRARVTTA